MVQFYIMIGLYFYHGPMGSAKTAELLISAYNLEKKGKKILTFKPIIDTRDTEIKSRAGLERKAIPITEETKFDTNVDCIFVDEAQFLSAKIVNNLRVAANKTLVRCYGLRTDFRTDLFEGSQRLFAVADKIIQIDDTCSFCSLPAIFNMRHRDGKKITEGEQVEIGDAQYVAVCSRHYGGDLEGESTKH